MRRDLPPSQTNSTSDDYTDMTWHAPTARFYVARPALKAPPGYAYPTWAMNALGGIPATIDPMVLCAAKTVALTALRLIQDSGCERQPGASFRSAAPARTRSRRSAITKHRSICDGRNTSPRHAVVSGGSQPAKAKKEKAMNQHTRFDGDEGFSLQRRNPAGGTRPLKQWGFRNETDPLTDVLLGSPAYLRHLATSSLSKKHLRENPANIQIAQAQHKDLVAAYEHFGVNLHWLHPEPELPMQVYSRDSSVMTPYGAIITAMANWWRRGENYAAIRAYEQLGIPIYDMVTAGTFEGGDFNVIEDGCVLIGCGGARTQEEGARQVESWFKAEGWETRLAFFDEYYVHIDLMVVPIAPKLTCGLSRLHRTRHRRLAEGQRTRDHRRAVPRYDGARLQFHVARPRPCHSSEGQPGPDRPAPRSWLRGRGSRHERDLKDGRRHPLHGAGAASRSSLRSAPASIMQANRPAHLRPGDLR
jgi:N-dimethylarginine dimethylaminohydrolase